MDAERLLRRKVEELAVKIQSLFNSSPFSGIPPTILKIVGGMPLNCGKVPQGRYFGSAILFRPCGTLKGIMSDQPPVNKTPSLRDLYERITVR